MFAESPQTLATGASQTGKLKEKSDQLRLVDAVTGKLLRSLAGHTGSIASIAFDPTSSFLASGSGDGSAGIWATRDGRVLMTRAVAGTGGRVGILLIGSREARGAAPRWCRAG